MVIARRVTTALAALLALTLLFAATPSQAENGRVRISVLKAGFIVGASGGRGTLTFRGKTYPLRIGGLSAGFTFGGSKAELIGTAYNLRSVSDIEGTYTQGEFGVAAGGGAKVAQLRNGRGVLLAVQGRQIGLEVALDLSGIQIALGR